MPTPAEATAKAKATRKPRAKANPAGSKERRLGNPPFHNRANADYAVPDWIDDHLNAYAIPQDNDRAGCPAALVKEPDRRNPRPWLNDANR